MKGSLLKADNLIDHLEASKFTNVTYEKPTYALSTFNISNSKISEKESEDSLSFLILNFETFWLKKNKCIQKENSQKGFNLDLNSVISSSSRHKQSVNDLSLKSKSGQGDGTVFQLIKNTSIQLPKIKKSPSFQKPNLPQNHKLNFSQSHSLKQISLIGLSSVSQQSNQNQNQRNKELPEQFLNKNSEISSKNNQNSDQKLVNSYVEYLESLSLVGKICSELLDGTKIRWKNIAILLYIQCLNCLTDLRTDFKNNVWSEPSWIRKSSQSSQNNANPTFSIEFQQIIALYSRTDDRFSKFILMVNQSKKMIEDIMNEKMNTQYHFCMHRIISALAMLASVNGMKIVNLELIGTVAQMTPQILRQNMLVYKQIIQFSRKKSF